LLFAIGRQSLIWSVLLSIPLAVGGYALARPIIGLFGLALAPVMAYMMWRRFRRAVAMR